MKEDILKKMTELDAPYQAITWALEQRPKRLVKPAKPKGFPKTAAEARVFADALEAYELAMRQYQDHADECGKVTCEIETAITSFIKREAGLDTIPGQYQDKVWQRAWRDGHSAGYYEVYLHLCELVDIFE